MTSDGGVAQVAGSLDLGSCALAVRAFGTTLDLHAGDVLRTAASLLVLALLWWPFLVAAVLGTWLVFVKAGRPGWACLVPGYNGAEFLRVAKLPAWLWFLFLVPVANVVLFAVACVRLARLFRKGPSFAAGLVLFPPVYMAILGMSEARYRRFDVIAGEKEADSEPLSAPAPAASVPLRVLPFPARPAPDAPGVECRGAAVAAGGMRGRAPGPCEPPPIHPANRRLHLV